MYSSTSPLSEVFWPLCHQWLQRAKDCGRAGPFTAVDWLLVGECGIPRTKQGGPPDHVAGPSTATILVTSLMVLGGYRDVLLGDQEAEP